MNKLVLHPSHPFSHALKPFGFESIWEQESTERITAYRTSDVTRIRFRFGSNEEGISCYRKRYWYLNARGRLKAFFRNTFFGSSRAHAEFENLRTLNDIGLSLVRPIAYGEDRFLRLLRRAFILTEEIPGTRSLDHFLVSDAFQKTDPPQRRRFLCSLGRWVSQLHMRGYRDRDLHARNILIHPSRQGWCFSKIDASAATGGKAEPDCSSPFQKDLKDLDQDLRKCVSRTDRLRCMLAYTAAGDVDAKVRRLLASLT